TCPAKELQACGIITHELPWGSGSPHTPMTQPSDDSQAADVGAHMPPRVPYGVQRFEMHTSPGAQRAPPEQSPFRATGVTHVPQPSVLVGSRQAPLAHCRSNLHGRPSSSVPFISQAGGLLGLKKSSQPSDASTPGQPA